MSDKKRLEELQYFVGICFAVLNERNQFGVTGLSKSTVNRLANGQFTLAVRFGTIQLLGQAAGFSLCMNKMKMRAA